MKKLTKVEKQHVTHGVLGIIVTALIGLKLWPRKKPKTPTVGSDPIIQTWKSLDL